MHICMVMPHMPMADGAFVGGSVNGMVGLLKGLNTAVAMKIVLTGARWSESRALKAIRVPWVTEFIPVSVLTGRSSVLSTLELLVRLPAQCKRLRNKHRVDVVHGHSGYALHSSLTLACSQALRTPAVHTLYCPVARHINDKPSLLLNDSLARLILGRLDKIIAISHNLAQSLLALGLPQDRVTVIPLPVELDRFNPSLVHGRQWREQMSISATAPVILFGGNNTTHAKGLDVLLEAMPQITHHHPDVIFVWTLYKKERLIEIQRELDKWGLQDNVRQLGIVDNMPEIMAASDILVAPFNSTEGPADYPLMLLEAMAMGKPVITTPVGGIPEVIEHRRNGLLVALARPDQLTQAVLSLLCDEQMRHDLGQSAAETVRARFSPQSVAQQVMRVYQGVIRDFRARRGSRRESWNGT